MPNQRWNIAPYCGVPGMKPEFSVLEEKVMAAPTMNEVAAMLSARYADVSLATSWGETALFYNPGKRLPRGIYFATLKDHDGANDKASALHRPGVFRLSLGLPRGDYISRFGPMPFRPGKGGVVLGPWDFTALDQLSPHPIYAWMGWVAVLNPSHSTLAALSPLFDAAFDKARHGFRRRLG